MIGKDVLVVFVKRPQLGQVKTRLAASIGAPKALAVYERLLAITRNAVVGWSGATEIHVTGPPEPFEGLAIPPATWYAQVGADLGARMHTAFEQAFARGADRVVLIGSDLPDLTEDRIQEAFAALRDHEVVLGPANDGGYYLIGLNAPHAELFRDMDWSTEGVFRETIRRLQAGGISFHVLPIHRDIDDLDDLLAAGWGDMLG